MVFVAVVLIGGGWALASVDGQKAVVHFSFDDVSLCLNNIKTKNYDSIFDEPFLGKLKSLNEEYNACFSLYVYGGALENQPTKYADEWQECSSWLKFGLHYVDELGYGQKSYEDGFNDWNNFAENIYKMSGSYSLIDRVVRLHFFDGSGEAIRGMSEAKFGPVGFLCADDERLSYTLTKQEQQLVKTNDYINKDGFVFFSTDIRCEKCIDGDFYKYLENTKKQEKITVVFTHEWQVYNGEILTENSFWIADACKFFKEKNIEFCFLEKYGEI